MIKHRIEVKTIFKDFLKKVDLKESIFIVFLHLLLTFGFVFVLTYLLFKFAPNALKAARSQPGPLDAKSISGLIISLINVALIGPILEELMFRGVILKRLELRWGISAAIIIASLIFGLLHIQLSILGSIFFGIMMSLLYFKSGNIMIPMFTHILTNLSVTLLVIPFYDSRNSDYQLNYSTSEINTVGLIGFIILLIALFLALRFISKNWPKKYTISPEY